MLVPLAFPVGDARFVELVTEFACAAEKAVGVEHEGFSTQLRCGIREKHIGSAFARLAEPRPDCVGGGNRQDAGGDRLSDCAQPRLRRHRKLACERIGLSRSLGFANHSTDAHGLGRLAYGRSTGHPHEFFWRSEAVALREPAVAERGC